MATASVRNGDGPRHRHVRLSDQRHRRVRDRQHRRGRPIADRETRGGTNVGGPRQHQRHERQLGAYQNEVSAKAGKDIRADLAQILADLAEALKK